MAGLHYILETHFISWINKPVSLDYNYGEAADEERYKP